MQHIIRHLFKAGSLKEVPKERLEELIQEYPSFSLGHYLLSSKLHAEDAANFFEETERTNLYFANPFWLQWQLQNTVREAGVRTNGPAVAAVVVTPEVQAPVAEELEKTSPVVAQEPLLAPELDRSEEAFENLTPAGRTETLPEEQEPVIRAATEEGYVNAEVLEEVEEEAVVAAPGEAVPWEEELGPGNGEVIAETPHAEDVVAEDVVAEDVVAEDHVVEDHVVEESSADKLLKSILEARNLRQSLAEINDRIAVQDTGKEATPQQEAAPHEEVLVDTAAAQVAATTMPVANEATIDTTVDAPVFQSYHTIDYFASQGIKLSLDENPNDRLGRQMKSFTDWLKVMKRLPQKDAASVPDLAAEHQVQAIAAHSIEGKDVVTETMAEVLAKQGMREKATEVYRKLSLLNPGKSAYFAARIEELKII